MSKKPTKAVSVKKEFTAPAKQPQYTKRLKARRKRKAVHFFKNPFVVVGGFLLLSGLVWLIYTSADIWHQNSVQRKESTLATNYDTIAFDSLTEWTDEYRIYISYPTTDNAEFNDSITNRIDEIITDFRDKVKERTNTSGKPYELNINSSISYATDIAVGVTSDQRIYTGGDELMRQFDIIIDPKTGKEIPFASLFNDDSYKSLVSKQVILTLPKQLGEAYNETAAKEHLATDTEHLNEYQLVDENTFNVIFQPGEVADSSKGVIKVPITFDSVGENLSDLGQNLFPKVAQAVKDKKAEAARIKAEQDKFANAPPQVSSGNVDCSVAKCIALTFDDGPGAPTDDILDTLKQYNAKATFFYIGRQIPARTAELQRAHAEGHDLGIHTWDHLDLATSDPATVASQVNRTRDAIVNATGVRPVLVRPPYGAYTKETLQEVGLPFILWNIDPDDWRDKNATVIRDRVMAAAKPGGIVLSHGIYQTTADAYKQIIPGLINQGYSLVSITDMFDIDPNNPEVRTYYGY